MGSRSRRATLVVGFFLGFSSSDSLEVSTASSSSLLTMPLRLAMTVAYEARVVSLQDGRVKRVDGDTRHAQQLSLK